MDGVTANSRAHKRSLSSTSLDQISKSDLEKSELSRDRKDKKRRKKKRKVSVVQETDGQQPTSILSSRSQERMAVNISVSPEPLNDADATSPSLLAESALAIVPKPEFVEGSSLAIPHVQMPVANPSVQEATLLKESLATQTKSLQIHEAFFASVLPSLTCQVCLDLLHKPFVLAPCGHMACYSCLVSWFTTPPANDNVHELPMFRKKTCPHCRAVVRNRPAEVWGVKEMVASVVKSGLALNFPAPPPDELSLGAARDPWANIFHPPLGASALHHVEGDQAHLGMYDAEDGVYRCLDCMHEIWEGSCAQCGRIYPGHDGNYLGSDDEDDVAHMVDALRNGLVSGFHPVQGVLGLFGNPQHSDEDDDISETSYESSFIDDGDSGGDAAQPRSGVIDLTLDGREDEGRERSTGPPPGRITGFWVEDEDEDEDYVPLPLTRIRRTRVIEDIEDEDESDSASRRSASDGRSRHSSEDDGAIAGPARRLARYIRGSSAGYNSDGRSSDYNRSDEEAYRPSYSRYDEHSEANEDTLYARSHGSDDD